MALISQCSEAAAALNATLSWARTKVRAAQCRYSVMTQLLETISHPSSACTAWPLKTASEIRGC